LTLAMGDPLSICTDPQRAANEMFRCCGPGGVVVATADNRLSAAAAYLERGELDLLEVLHKTGRTRWVTADAQEQFELHTFTPAGLRRVFQRSGFEVLSILGKTVLDVRGRRDLLGDRDAFRRLLRIELDLCRDPLHAARAGHLQITARRPHS
jgi:SAM-dependent methyltransferase